MHASIYVINFESRSMVLRIKIREWHLFREQWTIHRSHGMYSQIFRALCLPCILMAHDMFVKFHHKFE